MLFIISKIDPKKIENTLKLMINKNEQTRIKHRRKQRLKVQ